MDNEKLVQEDLWQYRLLHQIVKKRPSKLIEVQYFVDGITSILRAINVVDKIWQDKLTKIWWDIEEVYSTVLSEDREELNSYEIVIVDNAYRLINSLVESKLQEMEKSMEKKDDMKKDEID
jgi:hypothetical protein